MIEEIEKLKKIELHLHLDGSVRIETVEELLNKKNLEKEMRGNNCKNLEEYLTKFTYPLKVMQTKENLERIAYELCLDLKKDNVIYAEIRFAPNKHTENLSLVEVVDSVLKGLRKSDIKTNLILCCMRGDSLEENLKIVSLAKKYKNKGVVAIDLAGDEKNYPNELYNSIFEACRREDIPYTIHSGEAAGVDSIKTAISFQTKRIGHGIAAIQSEDIIKEIKEKKITLEICPTSNIDTFAVVNMENHPIKKLYEKGILVTINTDNRTVSNTTLNKEYEKLFNSLHFTINDFIKMNKMALAASFLTREAKEKLLDELEK